MKADLTRSKRIGILHLPIKEVEAGLYGEILAKISFTPIRVECHHYSNKYEMVGLSPLFPEKSNSVIAPEYMLKVHVDDETGNFESVEVISE